MLGPGQGCCRFNEVANICKEKNEILTQYGCPYLIILYIFECGGVFLAAHIDCVVYLTYNGTLGGTTRCQGVLSANEYVHNLEFIPCTTICLFGSKLTGKQIQLSLSFNLLNWISLPYSQRPIVSGDNDSFLVV